MGSGSRFSDFAPLSNPSEDELDVSLGLARKAQLEEDICLRGLVDVISSREGFPCLEEFIWSLHLHTVKLESRTQLYR